MSVLYLIGTPIGNLGDLTPRAAETLSSVDFIAAEDTRVTLKLLNHLGVKKPLISYYQAQKGRPARAREIVSRILSGENGALVTDAGMPAVSDPGEELVALCAEAGVPVVPVPGPTAAVTALAVSGLPTARFSFEGFLPAEKARRREALEELKEESRTMIFYEAPHRLRAALADLREAFGGDRRAAVCRELTKLHEEILRLTLAEAAALYAETEPRGEFVLVIAGREKTAPAPMEKEDAIALARELLAGGLSPAAAAKQAARQSGADRREIYRALTAGDPL